MHAYKLDCSWIHITYTNGYAVVCCWYFSLNSLLAATSLWLYRLATRRFGWVNCGWVGALFLQLKASHKRKQAALLARDDPLRLCNYTISISYRVEDARRGHRQTDSRGLCSLSLSLFRLCIEFG